jgi:large subunit ribosomal protein L11
MAQTIKVLVEGGKASAGPPLGPALGPTGINVGQVVAAINEKTKDFAGMKVPVDVTIDPKTKSFEIKTGSPPVSSLIIKELGVDKLSSNPHFEKVGNLAIEQIIKVAKGKIDSMNCVELKSAVRTVIGSCVSMGVLVEGLEPADALKAIDSGKYDTEISEGRTEVSAGKQKELDSGLSETKKELEKEAADLAKDEPEEEKAPTEEGEVKAEPEGAENEEKKEGKKEKH